MLDLGLGFGDVEDKRCMRKKLECSNNISFNVHIIYLEDGDAKSKKRVIDGSQVVELVEATTTKAVLEDGALERMHVDVIMSC
jgi:hypothetical protein